MQKAHGYALETRDACDAGEEGKSAQIALAAIQFLDPRTGLALLICRACDVARTRADARLAYVDRNRDLYLCAVMPQPGMARRQIKHDFPADREDCRP